MCCLSRAPNWGPGLKPRPVPWLETELTTFHFPSQLESTEPQQPGLLVLFLMILFLKPRPVPVFLG